MSPRQAGISYVPAEMSKTSTPRFFNPFDDDALLCEAPSALQEVVAI